MRYGELQLGDFVAQVFLLLVDGELGVPHGEGGLPYLSPCGICVEDGYRHLQCNHLVVVFPELLVILIRLTALQCRVAEDTQCPRERQFGIKFALSLLESVFVSLHLHGELSYGGIIVHVVRVACHSVAFCDVGNVKVGSVVEHDGLCQCQSCRGYVMHGFKTVVFSLGQRTVGLCQFTLAPAASIHECPHHLHPFCGKFALGLHYAVLALGIEQLQIFHGNLHTDVFLRLVSCLLK